MKDEERRGRRRKGKWQREKERETEGYKREAVEKRVTAGKEKEL